MKLTRSKAFLLIAVIAVAVAAEVKVSQLTPTSAVLPGSLFMLSEPSGSTYVSRSARWDVMIPSLTNVNALSIGSAAVDNTEFSALDGVTATATAGRIPIANGSAKLDTWITTGSTTAAGLVELATDGEAAASVAVQGNDSRMSNARTPTAHAASHQTGGSDALGSTIDSNAKVAVNKNSGATVGTRRRLNLIEGSGVTLTIADDAGNEEVDVTINSTGGAQAPVTLTDAATIAVDASLGSHFRVTLGGNRTLGVPTNPTDGQRILVEASQDATGNRILTPDPAAFVFGATVTTFIQTTNASARDYFTAVYNSARAKWDVSGNSYGFLP